MILVATKVKSITKVHHPPPIAHCPSPTAHRPMPNAQRLLLRRTQQNQSHHKEYNVGNPCRQER